MRKFVLAAAMVIVAQGAQAADMPDLPVLRGSFPDGLSSSRRSWEGWYVGGQYSFSSGDIDFGHAPASLTSFMLRNTILQAPVSDWTLLPRNHATGTGFGGFVGRNWQWEDAVIGLEANYNHISGLSSSTSNVMGRSLVNPTGSNPPSGHTYTYNVALSGDAALAIKDVVTLRARAGWAAGDFMPYMFGGLAVGRIDSARSANLAYNRYDDYDVTTTNIIGGNAVSTTVHQQDVSSTTYLSQTEARANSFVGGYTIGLGTEMMLFGNLFARAEWEYVKFLKVKDIASTMNSVRAGIGYKF